MANTSASFFERSSSGHRKPLLCNDEPRTLGELMSLEAASLERKIEALSVSKRLARTFGQKFKKKKKGCDLVEEEAVAERSSSSSNCISLYIKGGGCSRVGSCEEIDVDAVKKASISDDCLPLKGIEKKSSRKAAKASERRPLGSNLSSVSEDSLPDDVLEMILVRLPLRTLVAARLVCRKWSRMVVSRQFLQLRSDVGRRSPWAFVFGLTRKGVHAGEVFALDIVEDQWHSMGNNVLKGRFLYSVASVGMDIYIVGGCSALRTHRDVFVFSPLTNVWRGVCPMKVARSEPVLGVFEISSNFSEFVKHDNKHDQNRVRSRAHYFGSSEVYEDPHRLSLRCQLNDAFSDKIGSTRTGRKQVPNLAGQGKTSEPKFALIAVGGGGSRDEPLDSGEIYDSATDSWIEIARLPEDFGAVSSGAVCSRKFYVYSSTSNKLASYDLDGGLWVQIQTSQSPPWIRSYSPKLVSCCARLFMCGVCWSQREGQANNGREQAVRELWELNPATHSWSEVSGHPDAPMDKNAIFVADGDRIYGLDMFRVFGQALDFLTACRVHDRKIEWFRVTRKHAGHEGCTLSCMAKTMVVLHL